MVVDYDWYALSIQIENSKRELIDCGSCVLFYGYILI